MEKEELKDKCEELFDYFDMPNDLIPDEDQPSFRNLLGELFAEEWDRVEKAPTGSDDELTQLYTGGTKVAFAFGYVVGRHVDPGQRRIRDAEKVIERVIKEKELLLYVSREKKAERGDD